VVLGEGLQKKFPRKLVMLMGMILATAGCILLPFADSKEKYWRFAFPGLFLGTAGVSMVFTISNIAIFKVTPPSIAGTVGAIYNCVLNLGCATGAAIIISIQTSIDNDNGSTTTFKGRAAGFWFLFAFTCILTFFVAIFMTNKEMDTVDAPNANSKNEISVADVEQV